MPSDVTSARSVPAETTLGERLRQLRTVSGLTQSDLAGERFSKEYVSQIERGKTHPTTRTLDWLAERLGVDREFLETGLSEADRMRSESTVVRAEAAHRVAALRRGSRPRLARSTAPIDPGDPAARAARRIVGSHVSGRAPRGSRARQRGPRARRGAALHRSRSGGGPVPARLLPLQAVVDQLGGRPVRRSTCAGGALRASLRSASRAHSSNGASRCYRRQRDWEAAREDIERALELAEGLGDRETIAHVYFQASLVAERQGQWVLARSYAERSKALYEEVADRQSIGRLLNNLGGLTFLLGKPDEAVDYLKQRLRDRARGRRRRRRRAGRLLARAGAPPNR